MDDRTEPSARANTNPLDAFAGGWAKDDWLRRNAEAAQPQADTPWQGATALFYGQASSWGEGPWAGEPDHVRWVDPATGLHCIARRSFTGSWCGYVAVEAGHPLHGKGYDEAHQAQEDLTVHGGLTFAEPCEDSESKAAICHDHDGEEPAWWFGFDCAHSDDFYAFYQVEMLDAQNKTPEQEQTVRRLCPPTREHVLLEAERSYKTLAYVRDEVEDLARQLKEVAA